MSSAASAADAAAYCRRFLGKDHPLGSIDRKRMNVKGSSIAFGHPFAATGARMTVTMINELRRRGGRTGLVSMCAGGGMGSALVFEVL